ncbi:MAG: 3-deoxy-7-phosphoheptulonate synthase [Spirochaetales bacterium]|nr:3-deoxy-7-phosphoheptulonate synthase [Spirochaetales bacterium]
MILLAKPHTHAAPEKLLDALETRGYRPCRLATSEGPLFTVLDFSAALLADLPGEAGSYALLEPREPYVLAGKSLKDTPTEIDVRGTARIGGQGFAVIAGPCSVESPGQIEACAAAVKKAGAAFLRGGAYKPRTSPYAFQGRGKEGLRWLKEAGDRHGLPVVTEVLDQDDLGAVTEYADILQVGARNCQNYALLKKLGKIRKPVLLKRGMMVTIDEFLLSAEYVLAGGNMEVVLCERGIRTFEPGTRNTLDISAVPQLKLKTHLPVVVDPSHAAGSWRLVEPLALAAAAAGADGLMVEVHPCPENALSDGEQSLKPERFASLMDKLARLLPITGRTMGGTAGVSPAV